MVKDVLQSAQEFRDSLSPDELTAYSRGQVWGSILYTLEQSNLRMSPDKSNEIVQITDSIILQPESLSDFPVAKYNSNFKKGEQDALDFYRLQTTDDDLEDREKFFDRMADFSENDQLRIRIAYDLAKYSHRGTVREGKERYFEHVRSTALILYDECKLRDPDMIIAALLHDVVEDETTFGPKKELTTKEWMEEAGLRLDYIFGRRVSEMVSDVTKPQIDGVDILDRKMIKDAYNLRLEKAKAPSIVIKMADRLHNLRTLLFRSKEDQKKVARETLEIYYPMFKVKTVEYGAYTDVILNEIRDLANQYLSEDPTVLIKGRLFYKWDQLHKEGGISMPNPGFKHIN